MGTSSKVNGRTIKYNYFLYTGRRLWGIHPRGCAKSIRTQGGLYFSKWGQIRRLLEGRSAGWLWGGDLVKIYKYTFDGGSFYL